MTEAAIQWFPGHMAKALRLLEERLALVDVVIEVVDGRLPETSANPQLARLAGARPRLLVLSREDLADPAATRRWLAAYAAAGRAAVAVDGRAQPAANRVRAALDPLLTGRGSVRAIVVGIPNTGKSSLINGLLRRTAARAENTAGVTRRLQWFRLNEQIELMDTPGILVPKIIGADAQWQLALTGALPPQRYDAEVVIGRFAGWAAEHAPALAVPDLPTFAQRRGFIRSGGEPDLHNAAGAYLRTFNAGGLGRLTFDEVRP